MARAQTTESLLQSLTPEQREVATRILGHIPRTQQAAASQVIQQIVQRCGSGATDALRYLEGIDVRRGRAAP
jgi:hypothetical protein